ncbi:hypothetical protein Plhal304r1_c074g0162331 [Plasmopara halstedii]
MPLGREVYASASLTLKLSNNGGDAYRYTPGLAVHEYRLYVSPAEGLSGQHGCGGLCGPAGSSCGSAVHHRRCGYSDAVCRSWLSTTRTPGVNCL